MTKFFSFFFFFKKCAQIVCHENGVTDVGKSQFYLFGQPVNDKWMDLTSIQNQRQRTVGTSGSKT